MTKIHQGQIAAQAEKNIAKWGKQDLRTLALAISEESGEFSREVLQMRTEEPGGTRERIRAEAIDLGALVLQVLYLLRHPPCALCDRGDGSLGHSEDCRRWEADKTVAERKLERLREIQAFKEAGYAGVTPTGEIVDRRLDPNSIPMQANPQLRIPEPKQVPDAGAQPCKDHCTHYFPSDIEIQPFVPDIPDKNKIDPNRPKVAPILAVLCCKCGYAFNTTRYDLSRAREECAQGKFLSMVEGDHEEWVEQPEPDLDAT